MTTPELQPAAETVLHTLRKRKSNWGFGVWLACSWLLTLVVVGVGSAWAVRHSLTSGKHLSHAQKEVIIAVASFPGTLRDAVQEFMWQFSDDPEPLLQNIASKEKPYWVRHFPEPADSGYLLFAGADPKAKQSIVELIRVSDGKPMARWVPDWGYIFSNAKYYNNIEPPNAKTLRPIHPLLMSNGDIVFNTNYSLIRMNPCSGKPIWKIDKIFHHSNELDRNGNIVTLSKSDVDFPIANWPSIKWQDDSIATISPNGDVMQNISFATILLNNNLTALFLGIGGEENINGDPIHLNQVTPALTDSKFWKKDDLLVSSRNLSTVFLYRPSTGKIIWYQTGPWLNQHSVAFVGNNRISVFNNNIVVRPPYDFIRPEDHNTIMVFNFENGKTSEPFKDLLNEAQPRTTTEGRSRILPDGGLFIEETNNGRQMRFSTDKLLWSRINENDAGNLYALSWSRYLTKIEAEIPLNSIKSNLCANRE